MSEKTEMTILEKLRTEFKFVGSEQISGNTALKIVELVFADSTPSPALQDAVKETFGAIHLFAKEGHAVVSIEVNDKWIELMKEPLDSPFSHIIEPLGIQRKIEIA